MAVNKKKTTVLTENRYTLFCTGIGVIKTKWVPRHTYCKCKVAASSGDEDHLRKDSMHSDKIHQISLEEILVIRILMRKESDEPTSAGLQIRVSLPCEVDRAKETQSSNQQMSCMRSLRLHISPAFNEVAKINCVIRQTII